MQMYPSEMLCMKMANNVDSCKHECNVGASENVHMYSSKDVLYFNQIVRIISFSWRKKEKKTYKNTDTHANTHMHCENSDFKKK